jgi:hypothetical protein
MINIAKRKLLLWILVYIAVCLILDFVPHFGPPAFRYNGSDPLRYVWNFGWPLALFIYDPELGLQGFTFRVIFTTLLAQLFLLGVLTGIVAIIRALWFKLKTAIYTHAQKRRAAQR